MSIILFKHFNLHVFEEVHHFLIKPNRKLFWRKKKLFCETFQKQYFRQKSIDFGQLQAPRSLKCIAKWDTVRKQFA